MSPYSINKKYIFLFNRGDVIASHAETFVKAEAYCRQLDALKNFTRQLSKVRRQRKQRNTRREMFVEQQHNLTISKGIF